MVATHMSEALYISIREFSHLPDLLKTCRFLTISSITVINCQANLGVYSM